MPSKTPRPYHERFPNYGVPYSMIAYRSWAEKILYYAHFKKKFVSREDYAKFLQQPFRKDMWRDVAVKLSGYGWIDVNENDEIKITATGRDAVRNISARNSQNPKRHSD